VVGPYHCQAGAFPERFFPDFLNVIVDGDLGHISQAAERSIINGGDGHVFDAAWNHHVAAGTGIAINGDGGIVMRVIGKIAELLRLNHPCG